MKTCVWRSTPPAASSMLDVVLGEEIQVQHVAPSAVGKWSVRTNEEEEEEGFVKGWTWTWERYEETRTYLRRQMIIPYLSESLRTQVLRDSGPTPNHPARSGRPLLAVTDFSDTRH